MDRPHSSPLPARLAAHISAGPPPTITIIDEATGAQVFGPGRPYLPVQLAEETAHRWNAHNALSTALEHLEAAVLRVEMEANTLHGVAMLSAWVVDARRALDAAKAAITPAD